MNKFKYKYEIVKNVKGIQEARIQKEIAELELQVTDLLSEHERVENMRKEEAGKLPEKNARAGELKFRKEYITYLEDQKSAIMFKADQIKGKITLKHKELVEKTKEKKIFSKLEEKHLQDFNFEQNKIDSMNQDEIAIQRFTRK